MHSWKVFTFYHESEHLMHCLVVQIQRYPVGQSCFTEKVMKCERIILQINGMSFPLHCQFASLIMTMKTPEDFRTVWTERFARNELNALDGTKRFENETESFGDWTKRNVLVTERNALRTEHFWGEVVRFRVCTFYPYEFNFCDPVIIVYTQHC